MTLKKLLGVVLKDMGFITEDQLASALKQQQEMISTKALPERLERTALVSRSRVDDSKEAAPLLGQILTDMGLITEIQLKNALEEQHDIQYVGNEVIDPSHLALEVMACEGVEI